METFLRDRIEDHDRIAKLAERFAELVTDLAILKVRMEHVVSDKQLAAELEALEQQVGRQMEKIITELRADLNLAHARNEETFRQALNRQTLDIQNASTLQLNAALQALSADGKKTRDKVIQWVLIGIGVVFTAMGSSGFLGAIKYLAGHIGG